MKLDPIIAVHVNPRDFEAWRELAKRPYVYDSWTRERIEELKQIGIIKSDNHET